jgi:hypothetical protein
MTIPAVPAPKRAVRKPAATATKTSKAAKPEKVKINTDKRYKLLTGIDDSAFCQKVSDHLDAGYELYGSPSITSKGSQIWAAQAVVRKHKPKSKSKKKK